MGRQRWEADAGLLSEIRSLKKSKTKASVCRNIVLSGRHEISSSRTALAFTLMHSGRAGAGAVASARCTN